MGLAPDRLLGGFKMALFATTVIMMGPTSDGVGIYPRSYITEASSEKEAKARVLSEEKKTGSPDRIVYSATTDAIPSQAIVNAHAKAGSAALSVTGVLVVTKSDDGPRMEAVNHISTGNPSRARDFAIGSTLRDRPGSEIVHASVTTASWEAVKRAASELEGSSSVRMTGRGIGDVEKYSAEAINRYRHTALADQDTYRARSGTIYAMMTEAASAKVSTRAAVVIAGAAIDTYIERRRDGAAHAQARDASARETAHRLDGMGRETQGARSASRDMRAGL